MKRIAPHLLVLSLCVTACKTPPPGASNHTTATKEAPTYQQLAEHHNARIAQLQKIEADGVIEIRWRDDKGNHFEQGDVELWLQLPRRTALRIEKIGEVLLWIGSDEQRYWLFDRTGKQRVLHVGQHDEPIVNDQFQAIPVKPLALLDLLALTPLPLDPQPQPRVEADRQHNAWMLQLRGHNQQPLRLYFDRVNNLPSRVEILDQDGEVLIWSMLERYKPVRLEDMSPLAFPKLAHRSEIITPAASNHAESGAGNVRLFLNQATGVVDDEILTRVFDLERLIKSLRPERFTGQTVEQSAAAPVAR